MAFLALGALIFGAILGILLPVPAFLLIALAATGVGILSAMRAGASFPYVVAATLCVVVLAQFGYALSLGLQALNLGKIMGRRKQGARAPTAWIENREVRRGRAKRR